MTETPSKTAPQPAVADLIAELEWRGLLHQCTDTDGLRAHLADPANAPRKIYSGFDPTAPSLTIGNLVPIMLLAHVKRAGHTPVVVMGGGTGLIGDPSGKSAERQLNTAETVAANVEAQRPIFDAVLDSPSLWPNCDSSAFIAHEHVVENNNKWLGGLGYIEALRDIGKHFSVNMMMEKESVKVRLNNREQGISYTEFSYMILQAYDFSVLYGEHEKHTDLDGPVTVQIGGSDQYGNIVTGTNLISKTYVVPKIKQLQDQASEFASAAEWPSIRFSATGDFRRSQAKLLREQAEELGKTPVCFGITAPLVTKADGTKFGKTESGAVWLTGDMTSPYAYYQFWLNATDEDAAGNLHDPYLKQEEKRPGWIRIFTFLGRDEIDALIARHAENPGMRELQRTLAQHATTILHGKEAMHRAEAAGKALFSGDITGLDEPTLLEVLADVPSSEHAKSDLVSEDGTGLDPIDLLKRANLASSNREAREFLGNGSVSINGIKIDGDTRITESHLLHGSLLAIRRGKKKWHLTRWA